MNDFKMKPLRLRFGLSPGSKLPTPDKLSEVNDPRTPCTGLGIISIRNDSPALKDDNLERDTNAFKGFPHRPCPTNLVEGRYHRIELTDYSLWKLHRTDYSLEPPSFRTSHSHGIRLYRHHATEG